MTCFALAFWQGLDTQVLQTTVMSFRASLLLTVMPASSIVITTITFDASEHRHILMRFSNLSHTIFFPLDRDLDSLASLYTICPVVV